VGSWFAKLDAEPDGGIAFDPDLLLRDFRGRRGH
jgi:hypothetical protein